jgi:ABC-type dipeptide/oligopeptide/nickel transport system permease component
MAAIITLITILYVGVSFIVDVLYAVIDPRIRLE